MDICKLDKSDFGTQDLVEFIKDLDDDFNPPFRTRIESIELFLEKLSRLGKIDVAYDHGKIVGAIGYYCNDMEGRRGYITYLGIRREYRRKGIAHNLLSACIGTVKRAGMRRVGVQTDRTNAAASEFYASHGFEVDKRGAYRSGTESKLVFELKTKK